MQQTSDLDSTILRLAEQLKGCVPRLAGHYCPSQNCGCSSVGRAPPCQGGRREFEPRHPLSRDWFCCLHIGVYSSKKSHNCKSHHPSDVTCITFYEKKSKKTKTRLFGWSLLPFDRGRQGRLARCGHRTHL